MMLIMLKYRIEFFKIFSKTSILENKNCSKMIIKIKN